jgi:hypothetical protein
MFTGWVSEVAMYRQGAWCMLKDTSGDMQGNRQHHAGLHNVHGRGCAVRVCCAAQLVHI